MSRFWKKASAIKPATHPPIKEYRMRFIDLLAGYNDAGFQLWRDGRKRAFSVARTPAKVTAGIGIHDGDLSPA
jgi:hypothetical protein